MKLVQGINNENIEEVLEQLWTIEQIAWNDDMATSREILQFRIKNHPEGLWRIFDDCKATAYMYFIRIDEDKANKYKTWFDFSNDGKCDNHTSQGQVLFAVTIGTTIKGHGNSLFQQGVNEIKNAAYPGVKYVVACSRVPTLSKYFSNADKVNVQNIYCEELLSDPVVKMLYDEGFKPQSLCKDGYSVDAQSLGHSVTMKLELEG